MTIETIVTAEMAADNTRQRRRNGLSGLNALNGLYFVYGEQNILTRHREELHLTASLIRNHAPCNSVAIYLCLYTSLIPTAYI